MVTTSIVLKEYEGKKWLCHANELRQYSRNSMNERSGYATQMNYVNILAIEGTKEVVMPCK